MDSAVELCLLATYLKIMSTSGFEESFPGIVCELTGPSVWVNVVRATKICISWLHFKASVTFSLPPANIVYLLINCKKMLCVGLRGWRGLREGTCTLGLALGFSCSSFLAAASMDAAAPRSSVSAMTVGSSGSTHSDPEKAWSCITQGNTHTHFNNDIIPAWKQTPMRCSQAIMVEC